MCKELVVATSLKIAIIEGYYPGYFDMKLNSLREEFGVSSNLIALHTLSDNVIEGYYDCDKAIDVLKPCIEDLISNDIIQPSFIEDTKEMLTYFNFKYLPIKDISIVKDEKTIDKINKAFDNLLLKGKDLAFKEYVNELLLSCWKDVDIFQYAELSDKLIAYLKMCFIGRVCHDVLGKESVLEIDIDVFIKELRKVEIKLFCQKAWEVGINGNMGR
ncbi:hypothetical protein [uncultured Clostridium sp.]|uniref:hypothetical protein n=1 Tax=uncultured Clostridium sp. TaxID=59620 RepID=UPI0026F396AD|nr:hypothetical protein [uncultured Clostridium sp.]